MRFPYYFLMLMLLTCHTLQSGAQTIKENELVVIKGEKFIMHHVRTGETIFSISRHYQVDSKTLIENNPNLTDGLKIGDVLKIPYIEGTAWQSPQYQTKGDPQSFDSYTISSRTQTPYFIAREFGITVEELYAYNPGVTRFRKGTRLRIPRWGTPPASITTEIVSGQQRDVSDRDLILYEIQPGESVASIARRFNVSESEIIFFNPGARELTPGSIIHLPRPLGEAGRSDLAEQKDVAGAAGGTAFFEHTIVSGETLWSVSRRYGVTEFDLKKMNPLLESGFPAGMTIKIPLEETVLDSPEPVNEEAFIRHEVKAGETMFGVSSRYNISIPDLRRFNPQLEKRNLVQGETLLIPRPEEQPQLSHEAEPADSLRNPLPKFESQYYEVELPVIVPENCRPENQPVQFAPTFEVALFLPLFIDENDFLNKDLAVDQFSVDSLLSGKFAPEEEFLPEDEDTLVEMDEPEELFYDFFRESENYMKFYEGVLIAVDSLQRAGMQIVLNVYDSKQNEDSIRQYIHSTRFLETDLIIGPVFPNVQEEVASIAAKNRIPVISPLSAQSRIINSNPYYFQVNPSRDFLISKTAEFIAEEFYNSNFVVIKTTHSEGIPEAKVVDIVRERLTPSGYWNNPWGMQYSEIVFSRDIAGRLNRILSKEKENVIFVSSMHEGDLSIILSNINNLAGNYPITLVGFNRYEQFQSIQQEFYHNLRLHYLTPYWVDYANPETIKFLEKFKKYFHTEPGNYGMQGYDIAFYFLNALRNFGKEFEECLPYQQVHLSQGSYRFEKQSAFGGYMNQGVSVISFEPNYDVVRKRVIGPYRFAQR